MPPLEYDQHARDRMAERGVDEQDVELALRRQIETKPGTPGSIWIHGYGKGDRVIPVCVLTANRNYIKTIGWPKQARRSRR